MQIRLALAVLVAVFAVSCGRAPDRSLKRVSFKVGSRTPSTTGGMEYFAVIVTGLGIRSKDDADGPAETLLPNLTSHCTYPGSASRFIPIDTTVTVDLFVPRGENRLFQVVGLDDDTGVGLPDMTASDFWILSRDSDPSVALYGGLYETGRQLANVFSDGTSVAVANVWSPGTPKNLRLCP